jgi:hypothetical protein
MAGVLSGVLFSHAVFLIVCESNPGGAPAYVDHEPNTTTSDWGDAGVRRSLPEDTRSERLHYFDFGPGSRSLGGSIRTCRRIYRRNIPLTRLQAKETATLSDRIYTILAVALLQSLGLFHQHSEQRLTSMTYHCMLVSVSLPLVLRLDYVNTVIQMIRRSGIMSEIAAWRIPDIDNVTDAALEAAWRDWAVIEMGKRCVQYHRSLRRS